MITLNGIQTCESFIDLDEVFSIDLRFISPSVKVA